MPPRVSVIIPTYNRADLLPRAIDSVLNQTYKDFELIIVDDGSTDNTKEIVEEYQKKDERIKYLWEENSGGPARPYNLALKQCQGEYIAFLDSDDVWLPEKLEKQIDFIEKNRIMGCTCLVFEYNIDTHKLVGVCSPTLSDFIAKRELMNYIFPLNEDLKGVADKEIYIRIEIVKMEKKIKSDDICTLEEPLVIYTRHSRFLSFGKQNSPFFIEEYSSLLEKYSYLKNKNNLTPALKNILSECYAKLALHYLIIEEKRKYLLEELDRIEHSMNKYVKNLDSKFYRYFLRIFVLKHKFFIKGVALELKNIFHLNLIKNIKLFWGRNFKVFLADADASSLYFFGSLYGEEIKIINFLVKNLKKDDIFYDIGANYGFYTTLAQEFISNGEIHSFEPHPQIFKLLKENARLDLFNNTFLNNFALSDKDGDAKFYDHFFDFHHSGRSSLINPSTKENKQIMVKSLKLDTYIRKDNKIPTIIKMDIEGGELLCLSGGIDLLSRYSPIIIMEFFNDDLHQKAINILLNNNYKMFQFNDDGDLYKIDDIERNEIINGLQIPQANYIFKK